MSSESDVLSLLSRVSNDNPDLYNLLTGMITDLYTVYNQINPPTGAKTFGVTGQNPAAEPTTGFIATLFNNNLRLSWDALGGLNTYELRYHNSSSTDWASATVLLRTSTVSADINPVALPLIYGTYTFLLKAVDSNGFYSATASSVTITIGQIAAPVITPTVIDNNVLLNWTAPTSTFLLKYYNIYKGGVLIGTMNGTFEAIFETVAGTFTYGVEAVDIVGNISTLGTITTIVNAPPDYALTDSRTSTLAGTKVNCKLELGNLIACIDLVEDYATHFTEDSWASPQAQITAGYPIFIQPNETTGSYEEIIDYGLLLSNVIIALRWSETQLGSSGTVTVAPKISTSTDNITYTSPTSASSLFSASMRYAKIHFDFSASSDKALLAFTNLQILLDVKREVDSGSISAISTDVGGTVVTFNKAFKSVDSITLSIQSTTTKTAVYDFAGGINPTTFKVLVFDSGGSRVSATVSWKARGVI